MWPCCGGNTALDESCGILRGFFGGVKADFAFLQEGEYVVEVQYRNSPAGNAVLQFSWRFLGPASVFLCIVSAVGIVLFMDEGNGREWMAGIVILATLCSASFYFDKMSQEANQWVDKMAMEGRDDCDAMPEDAADIHVWYRGLPAFRIANGVTLAAALGMAAVSLAHFRRFMVAKRRKKS